MAILFVLRDAAREVDRRLRDAVDPHLVDQAEQVVRATPGVVDVTDLRLRWLGHNLLAEATINAEPLATPNRWPRTPTPRTTWSFTTTEEPGISEALPGPHHAPG